MGNLLPEALEAHSSYSRSIPPKFAAYSYSYDEDEDGCAQVEPVQLAKAAKATFLNSPAYRRF